VIAMSCVIFKPSNITVLQTMEASTAHGYYLTELEDVTGLAKPTLITSLRELRGAGLLCKETVYVADSNHAPRIYYTLSEKGLYTVRLYASST
jgi:hypothetical protein